MPEPVIYLDNLSKTYLVPEREAGLLAAAKSLVRRRQRAIKAVDQVSFAVASGEIVGFLGPNGAGKTTTLKMLAGLLHPTSGVGRVLDYKPWQRKREFLRAITLVMGQRNQLSWDIPASDSFELNRVIYRVPLDEYRQTLGELSELLELGPLVNKPVRNLSLGERMKCEIAAALLHRPRVLFLDEPTIGLDVTAQRRIREFIREYNQRHNATILLTSHYMADVEALCQRVVVIHHGRILFDGPLTDVVTRFSPHKTITVDLEHPVATPDDAALGEVINHSEGRLVLRVPKAETAKVAGRLLAALPVSDLTIEDPPIEEVIEQLFAQEVAP
jgi:ABC-2 type transport system ATP-binding protein